MATTTTPLSSRGEPSGFQWRPALRTRGSRVADEKARCYLCHHEYKVMKNPLDACLGEGCSVFGEGYHLVTLNYADSTSTGLCHTCLKTRCPAVYDASTQNVECVLTTTQGPRKRCWFIGWPRGEVRTDVRTGVVERSVEAKQDLSSKLCAVEKVAYARFLTRFGGEKWQFVERCSRSVVLRMSDGAYESCKMSAYTVHQSGNHCILSGIAKLGELEHARVLRWARSITSDPNVRRLEQSCRDAVYQPKNKKKAFVSYGFQIKASYRTRSKYEFNESPLKAGDIPARERRYLAQIVSRCEVVLYEYFDIVLPKFYALDVVRVRGDGTRIHMDLGIASGDGYENGVFLIQLYVDVWKDERGKRHAAKKLVTTNVASSTPLDKVSGVDVFTGDVWFMNDRAGKAAPHCIYCHEECEYWYIALRGVSHGQLTGSTQVIV